MKEKDVTASLVKAIEQLYQRSDAMTDLIALICLHLRAIDSTTAESIAKLLEGLPKVESATMTEELKWLAQHLTPILRGDPDAPLLLSVQKPPPVRDREALRNLIQVVPGGKQESP
ncbi:hypothetical protein [Giesbergeria anulus]|uniref:Uncharacterized protein n=1 Tax=Giesbergeria anulus TaxID=180197 RepID=A0A1H9E768_9BURK|nr:hypothetical protein [Giesbergeria anulus]SEQ21442.1 hypothetical protein SAMN02982919_00217 [Giesbergeria anulus]